MPKKIFCATCPKWEIKRPVLCSNTLKRGTKKFYFCTRRCKEKFMKASAK